MQKQVDLQQQSDSLWRLQETITDQNIKELITRNAREARYINKSRKNHTSKGWQD